MSRTVTDGVRGGSTMGHMTMGVEVEGSINAISACRDSSQVVVAGRSVFKIFSVEEMCFQEKLNLRVGRITLKYSCSDVIWHPLKDDILATGATNGHVFTWSLCKYQGNKLDQEFADHTRGVTRVCFHPSEWYILLSGSQDGTMKFFDLRSNKCEATFHKQNDSIRDIQFSPHNSLYFASTSDAGSLQTWDFRRSDRVLLNYMAHNGPAFSLDWHPDERNLIATCGRDKLIKVWRLDSTDNGITSENTIYCIASVARVKWRPEKKYHIASCSQVVDQTVCIWDVRRPYMPFAVFEEHKDMATGIVWRDPHVFMSGGKDGMLFQHIFKDAKRPSERVSPVGVSMSIFGNVCHVLSKSSQPETHVMANYSSTRQPMSFRRRGPTGMPDLFQPYESSMLVYNNEEKNNFSELFLACAHRYQLTGRSFPELCEHNANVCRQLGRYQIAQTWNMLKLIYSDNPMAKSSSTPAESFEPAKTEGVPELIVTPQPTENQNHTVESATGQTDEESALSDSELDSHVTAFKPRDRSQNNVTADFFFGEQVMVDREGDLEEIYEDDVMGGLNVDSFTLPNEAFAQRHEILDAYRPPSPDESRQSKPNTVAPTIDLLDAEPNTLSLGNQLHFAPAISPSVAKQLPLLQLSVKLTPIVADMLIFYANQGDVQMAVSALIVLGDRIKDKISQEDQEQWFLSYIDLLMRFKMWCIASEVIKVSNHSNVGSINQQSTTIHTKCNHCSASLDKYSWACQKTSCRKITNTCSLCHLPVKGLYVWCQGCSHGGHIQHMQEWFQGNQTCPTGCGHLCEYT